MRPSGSRWRGTSPRPSASSRATPGASQGSRRAGTRRPGQVAPRRSGLETESTASGRRWALPDVGGRKDHRPEEHSGEGHDEGNNQDLHPSLHLLSPLVILPFIESMTGAGAWRITQIAYF